MYKVVEKYWGREDWIQVTDNYMLKILNIMQGKTLLNHYHDIKEETFYIMSGSGEAIINGEKRESNGLGSGANPRTAIGQKADGTVLLLVTDGRGASGHLGATASDLIEVMEKYGAINAANLDGGSSSTMYYEDKYLMTSVTLYYSNSSWRLPEAFIIEK